MIFLAIMSHFCNVCHEGLKSIPAPSALYYNRLTNISKDFKFQMREIWYLFCSPIVHNTIAYCILLFQHWQKCVTITQDDAWLLVGLLYALCKATTYSVKPSWYRRSWNALTLITTIVILSLKTSKNEHEWSYLLLNLFRVQLNYLISLQSKTR